MRKYVWGTMLAALLLVGCDRGSHPGMIGKAAPMFTVSDGVTTVDLAKLHGRVVVLNFWGTWCTPCLEELPSLLEMQHEMPQLAVVAVSVDQDDDVYRKFLIDHHVNVLTVRDADQRLNAVYGTVKFPETYIIDKKGVLRRKFIDAQQWTSPDILQYLAMLANERP